jgi:hypothetical protein
MSLGPFITYVPPGVYTRTLTETNAANLVAGLRLPVYIGVGQEELEQTDLELVRGSSSTLDQQIVSEDVSQRFVVDETNPNNPVLGAANGNLTKFKVRNSPIVDGQGFGRVSNNIRSVSVTINGSPVAVGSVQGQNGYVILQIPAQPNDNVRCTYFFHRSDTAFTDDVSAQVTPTTADLTTPGKAPFSIIANVTDTFVLKIDGLDRTIPLAPGSYTAAALKSLIDSQLIPGLTTAVFTDNEGFDHITFSSAKSLEIGSGNANGAFGFTTGAKTTRNTQFRVFQRPVVDGTDGGITTTDPSKVTVIIDGSQVLASAVDGTNGLVTLPYAPAAGSQVVITYWANTWQDTFDYLPNTLVTSVTRCGFAPRRSDFIESQDFVVSNPSPDVSIIHWGASYVVASSSRTPGATPFDESQILPTLVDDRLFLVECTRVVNTTVVPAVTSPNQFTLPAVPTTGNGRDTPLGSALYNAVTNSRIGLDTNRPDLVIVRTGRNVRDALGRNPVAVLSVDAVSRTVTLKGEIPPDHKAFATFWFSRLSDDTYILTNKVAGSVGTGQYEVFSVLQNKNLYQARFGIKSGMSETIQWPRGVEQIPDAYHTGAGTPVAETVTVTFSNGPAKNAAFTNDGAAPYSFYVGTSDQWRTLLDATPLTTNLNTARQGTLVSRHVTLTGGNVTIPAAPNNVLSLTLDGVTNPASGQITAVGGPALVDGETFTLNDGVHPPTVFEFNTGVAGPGHVLVSYTAIDADTVVAVSIQTAINGVGASLAITAGVPAGAVVPLVNDATGVVGNQPITETVADPGFVVIGMTGGNGQVDIPLPTGSQTPSAIVAAINTVIDATGPFLVTAPNNLAATVTIGADAAFIIKSYSVPAALPGGFDNTSVVTIRQGTVENVLGFTAYQSANGTPTATNKPATILGTVVGPFAIVAGVNDKLNVRVNGVDYAVTLTAGPTQAASAVVGNINAVLANLASVGTLANVNKVRLTSSLTDPGSSIVILAGSANDTLGFVTGASASYVLVTAQEVVDELNTTTSFLANGVAYVSVINGSSYITIESLSTGITSVVGFNSGTASAFNVTTGTEIVPGTSGDNGEAASNIYTITSTSPSGSAGTGVPGQTYTDARTGLRFTILPSSTGNYTPSGFFTLIVTPTWNVNPAVPYLSLGGLELIVSDTNGVGVNDTATVRTFNPGGLEPAIGDFYFVTYNYMKQDFSTQLYQQFKTIEANFGPLSGENRVTLAAFLAIQNGAVLVGIKQVLKVPNTNQASDASFTAAINELAIPLPGNVKPNIIVPLATSTTVYSFLLQHVEVQSNIRNQSERMGFIGFASGTSPTTAQAVARGLVSNRMIAVYPDSAVITLTNELGENFETLVDGTFLAAALAGAVVSPAVDVATPYTRRRVQGFTRFVRQMDPIEQNQTAVAGVTLLEDIGNGFIRVRQGLTTDMSTILSRLPTVTQIADFVQQQSRGVLDAFVGTKFLASRTNEVEVSMSGLFKQLVQAEIVGAFTGISAEVDPNDPTIMRVESFYQPIFPLLYLVLTFNLRARI